MPRFVVWALLTATAWLLMVPVMWPVSPQEALVVLAMSGAVVGYTIKDIEAGWAYARQESEKQEVKK